MKTLIVLFLVAGLMLGCNKQNVNYKITEGYYEGYFDYKNTLYWCLIHLEDKKYVEWPSGGVWLQKSFGCLTVGDYSINGNRLFFELDSFKFEDFPEPCESDMLLPGEYKIHDFIEQDSLIFEKGNGNSRIVYYLKRDK